MMSKIKLSIIVAVYNIRNEFIDLLTQLQCIRINHDLEILVINDGSTDGIEDILNNIEQSSNFRIINRANSGLSAVRNYGISIAKGEYLWFIDGDDIICKSFVENMLNIIDLYSPDFVHFYYERFLDSKNINFKKMVSDGLFVRPISKQQLFDALVSTKQNMIENYAWAHIVKKKMYTNKNILFPENRNYEDVATTYKLIDSSNEILITNQIGYFYRDRRGSITNNYDKKDVLDLLIAIKEFINNSNITFTKDSQVNFIHKYLVGAYYMGINLKGVKENGTLIYDIRHKILENSFNNLTTRNKIEYLLFKFDLYSTYLQVRGVLREGLKGRKDE